MGGRSVVLWIVGASAACASMACAPSLTGHGTTAVGPTEALVPRSSSQPPSVETRAVAFSDGRERAVVPNEAHEAHEDAPPDVSVVRVPEGVTCAIRGDGAPFHNGCEPETLSAFSARRDGRHVATFSYGNVDITWGFFEGSGRAFVNAESGGILLRAYTDASSVLFRLGRDVEIRAGHVWLNQGAPVRVVAGMDGGVGVRVDGDVLGVEEILGHVECRDVGFETVEPTSFGRAPAASTPSRRVRTVEQNALRLFLAPGGAQLTTLRDSEDQPLPRFVDVLEEQRNFSRVSFETSHARFDVWVATSQLTDGGAGIGSSGGVGCGVARHSMSSRMPHLLADTHVRVGALPTGNEEEAITIREGTAVVVEDQRDGFAAVRVRSEIDPPNGQSFWIPKSALSSN